MSQQFQKTDTGPQIKFKAPFKAPSPLGSLWAASDGDNLLGLWFTGQKFFPRRLEGIPEKPSLSIFKTLSGWLDVYFSKKDPGALPPILFSGTPFQLEIWNILKDVPYGTTTTYQAIKKEYLRRTDCPTMANRAVANAIGHNPISILVPCHRVIAKTGDISGYAGGTEKKRFLLELEGSASAIKSSRKTPPPKP
jgi:methylated-DNA-[protein]-cysteine S-methyltransferase